MGETVREECASLHILQALFWIRMQTRFHASPFNWVDKLPDAARRFLEECFQMLTARQGGDAFRDGDTPPGIFRVISGRADMYVEAQDGRLFFLNWYLPGESFGEIPSLDDQPHIATVTLTPETIVAFLSIQDTQRLSREEPWFKDALIGAAANTFRSLYRAHLSHISLKPEDLVLDRLRFLARWDDQHVPTEIVIEITQDLIAKMLGLSLRRVSDALSKLEDKGQIKRDYGKIVLPNTHIQRSF